MWILQNFASLLITISGFVYCYNILILSILKELLPFHQKRICWAETFIFVSKITFNSFCSAMIGYTNKKSAGQPEAEWKGYVLAAGFFVVAILQSTFYHQNFHISMTTGMRARSALIAAVFKKVCWQQAKGECLGNRVRIIVLDATFNNISVLSWRSVLLLEETVVLTTSPHEHDSNSQF